MLGKLGTFSPLTCQEEHRECISTLRRHFAHRIIIVFTTSYYGPITLTHAYGQLHAISSVTL